MDPKAIISAIPMLRRAWRVLPPPLRVPVLLIAAAVGLWQFFAGRKTAATDEPSASDGAGSSQAWTNEPPPLPRDR